MAVERNDFTEAIRKSGYEWYWEEYEEINTTYQELFTEKDITAPYIKEVSSTGMGDLKEKPESEPIQEAAPQEGFPIYGKVRTFASKVSWSMELYDDSQVESLFQDTVSSWGRSVPRTKDRWYAQFFNYGGYTAGHSVFNNSLPDILVDSSGDLIYDGYPLFTLTNNARSSMGGETYFNSGGALDLDATNLQAVYQAMTATNNRDEKDDEIIIEPNILLIPPGLKFIADELLQYEKQNTDFMLYKDKPSIALAGKITPVVWPRLTDTDAWFLLEKQKGLIALNRMEEQIDFYKDNETKAYVASILVRFGGYVNNWRYMYGSNLATSA